MSLLQTFKFDFTNKAPHFSPYKHKTKDVHFSMDIPLKSIYHTLFLARTFTSEATPYSCR